jgi:phosphoglycolate phosphatase
MGKKYLLFDIDGTLIHAGGAGRLALAAALQEAGSARGALDHFSFAGKTDRQIVLTALRASGFPEDALSDVLAKVLDSYVARLTENLKKLPVRVYPWVRELLPACRHRSNLELVLLTGNIPRGARLKLESAGLWDFFSWGVFGDHSEERADLAREAFRRLTEGNGRVSPRDIFVIGDTCADIACGQAIGATTVAIISDFEPEEKLRHAAPDYLLNDFRPLFKLWQLPPPAAAV